MVRISNDDTIRVEGLAELRADLKSLDSKLPRELTKVGREVAKFVTADAKSAALTLGGVAAHVAPSLKPTATATSAGVKLDTAAFPEAAGAEFGGQRRDTTMQFQPWRGSDSNAGYFLYPQIRANSERIVDEFTAGVDRVMTKAGLKPE
jgi:hypothetical protein